MYKKAILHTEYFPSIGALWCLQNIDKVYLEHHETYQKKSTRNRTILPFKKETLTISVPLKKGKNRSTPITDVRISYDEDWPKKHLHTIQTIYGSAPYFIYYFDGIKEILNSKPLRLWDLNQMLWDFVGAELQVMQLPKPTKFFEKTYPQDTLDLRSTDEMPLPLLLDKKYPAQIKMKIAHRYSSIDLLMNYGPEGMLLL